MSIPPVTYEEFSASNQALTGWGGPWNLRSGDETQKAECISETESSCDGGWCLHCQVSPPNNSAIYRPSFHANVSFDLRDYGGETTLAYTWSFWPLYAGTNVPTDASTPVHSRVGDEQYDDRFPAADWTNFSGGGRPWNGAARFSHAFSTPVQRGSDGIHGYIPLEISFVMSPVTNSRQEYLHFLVKEIEFKIITHSLASTSASSVAASSSTLSVSSNSSSASDSVSIFVFASSPLNLNPQMDLHSIDPFGDGASSSLPQALPGR